MGCRLERGVDGIRVDVAGQSPEGRAVPRQSGKPRFSRHDPPSKRLLRLHNADLPEVHGIIAGEAVDRSIDPRGNESLVTELSAEADVPASVPQLGTLPAAPTFKMHDLP
jgi:hypothetical protein